MKTVYLHIGSPKTGTSSIQSYFSKNYKKLLKNGVFYPKSCRYGDAHHIMAGDLCDEYLGIRLPDFWYGNTERLGSWERFIEEFKSCPDSVDKVVFSSELFFAQPNNFKEAFARIKSKLEGFDVKIVVYLRQQNQLFSSFYNQDIKGMRQWDKSADEFYNTHQIFDINYYDNLMQWSDVFGKENVIIRPFERNKLIGKDIVSDFLSVIGLESTGIDTLFENDSLGNNQLYVKKVLNKVGLEKSDNERVLDIVKTLLPEEPAKNVLYINPKLYRKLKLDWIKDNNQLSKQFLGGERFFGAEIPNVVDLKRFQVDREKLVDFVDSTCDYFSGANRDHISLSFYRALAVIVIENNLYDGISSSSKAAIYGCSLFDK